MRSCLTAATSMKTNFIITENFERFLTGNKVSQTSKSLNSFKPCVMKAESSKLDFCAPLAWKKRKKEQ